MSAVPSQVPDRFVLTRKRVLAGFTLIEILLVMVLMAMVAVLALPNFSNSYKQMRWDQAVGDLVYGMRYAQSRAVSQGQIVRLVFDEEQQSYWLEELPPDQEEGTDQEFQRVTGSLGRVQKLPEGVEVNLPAGSVRFFPDGTIERLTIELKQGKPWNLYSVCQKISTELQRGGINLMECEP
jgi:type II secretion system protein H